MGNISRSLVFSTLIIPCPFYIKQNMERTKHRFTVLTNDPSFTAWGWAVLDEKGIPLEVGCIKTEPEYKKKRIRKGDDLTRRINEINLQLLDVIRRYDIKLILSELPHGSQNAQAAVMIGGVTAIIQTLSDVLDIAIEWYSEQDSKNAIFGKRAATKKAMVDAIGKLYKIIWTGIAYKDEAVADALAIHYVASQQSQILKMMRQ